MPFFEASTLVALVLRCTATPCFFRRSASGLTRSRSAPGISWSMNSTTVTSLPSARYTVAISRPMMPPPTTSSFFGMSARSSASVESITRGSSQGKPGSFTACEPAAMMHCSKRSSCVLPSSPAISEFVAATRTCRALHRAHLALLGHAGQALGELADHLVLVLAQLVEVDLRLAEVDADIGRVRGFLDHGRRMQQRLGRNAADVEADAAERWRSARPAPCPGRGRRRGTRRCNRRGRRRARPCGIRCRPCGRWPAPPCGAGTSRVQAQAGDGATRRASALAAAGAAARVPQAGLARFGAQLPALSRIATTLPSDSLSPIFTFNSLTTPAADDGTSIVALSDSSVTRPWSFFTVSPTATSISITGTSS